jgi:hypothetical protein
MKDIINKAVNEYLNFQIGNAITNIPYFNNKRNSSIGGFRVEIGKGSVKEIRDDIEGLMVKDHISIEKLGDLVLKKYITDKDIGIDCSGLIYHILDQVCIETKSKSIADFINWRDLGLWSSIKAKLRAAENTSVAIFASNRNSHIINLPDISIGDIITITKDAKNRDHILLVTDVVKEEGQSINIKYAHSIAYPEDGLYGTGVRTGEIQIEGNSTKNIYEGKWLEDNKTPNSLVDRMKQSTVEIRRLNWF